MNGSVILTLILISILFILLIALYLIQTDLVMTNVSVRRKFVSVPNQRITFMTIRNTEILEYIFIKTTKTTNITINLIPIPISSSKRRNNKCNEIRSCRIDTSQNDSKETISYSIFLECGRTGVVLNTLETSQLQSYDVQIETDNETVLDVVASVIQV